MARFRQILPSLTTFANCSSVMRLLIGMLILCSMLSLGSCQKQSESSTQKTAAPADPYDCKGNTPFLLQDPSDKTCLGPYGFTVCDEKALWVLNRRVDRVDTYSLALLLPPGTVNNNAAGHCLERKTALFGLIGLDRIGLGRCSKRSSKNWNFEFVASNSNSVLLSTKGMCLVRGALGHSNSVSLKPCTELKPEQTLKLTYSPTAIHENGFFLKAADGNCFDGTSFRSCYGVGANKLLWGIGMRYVGGEAMRYFFLFTPKERHNCLSQRGNSLEIGLCTSKSSLGNWGLSDGRLSTNNGDLCVSRDLTNKAYLTKCNKNEFEHIVMDIPVTYTSKELNDLIKNKEKLSDEDSKALEQLIHYHVDNEL